MISDSAGSCKAGTKDLRFRASLPSVQSHSGLRAAFSGDVIPFVDFFFNSPNRWIVTSSSDVTGTVCHTSRLFHAWQISSGPLSFCEFTFSRSCLLSALRVPWDASQFRTCLYGPLRKFPAQDPIMLVSPLGASAPWGWPTCNAHAGLHSLRDDLTQSHRYHGWLRFTKEQSVPFRLQLSAESQWL